MNTTSFHDNRNPRDVIVLPDSVYHSYLGEYFLGQTDTFSFDHRSYAWGGLVNPINSKVNLFLNAYTITNFSAIPITAEGWLSSELTGNIMISNKVAAGNQAMSPPSQPKVIIQSASHVTDTPVGGTYTFVRRVEPAQTLTKHDFQGMYIIPPGSSFLLFFLKASAEIEIYIKLAFGWWEEAAE